jgi:hypothetical protein
VRRLAIFWLACAAIGFLAAIGAALALSLALDGAAASWRAAPSASRLVQQKAAAAPTNAAAPRPQSVLAPLLRPGN